MKNKLYILIDQNLDPIYGAVQGGHAVTEWLLEHWQLDKEGDPQWSWHNDYLIYLQADLKDIKENYLEFMTYDSFSEFLEPDLDNKLTAIAIYEGDMSDRLKRKIKKLKLWGT